MESPVLSGVRARLQRDAWLYYAVLGYTLLGMLFLLAAGDLRGSSHAVYVLPAIKAFLIFMPLVALGYDASRVVLRVDQRRRLAFSRVLTPERFASLAAGIILMAGLTVFQGTFTTIKTALPQLSGGFPHDRVQADIDAMLFFGTDPWRLFHAVGGNAVVRTIVEFNYNVMWFAACYGVLFFVATSPRADGVPHPLPGDVPVHLDCLRQHPRRPVPVRGGRRFTGKSPVIICALPISWHSWPKASGAIRRLPTSPICGACTTAAGSASAAASPRFRACMWRW